MPILYLQDSFTHEYLLDTVPAGYRVGTRFDDPFWPAKQMTFCDNWMGRWIPGCLWLTNAMTSRRSLGGLPLPILNILAWLSSTWERYSQITDYWTPKWINVSWAHADAWVANRLCYAWNLWAGSAGSLTNTRNVNLACQVTLKGAIYGDPYPLWLRLDPTSSQNRHSTLPA
jgi:hypothetical protein